MYYIYLVIKKIIYKNKKFKNIDGGSLICFIFSIKRLYFGTSGLLNLSLINDLRGIIYDLS